MVAGTCVWIIIVFWLTWGIAAMPNEHVVQKDGKKMVASVNSWLEVTVYYYPYENWFFKGKKCLIIEHYGNGGYDPFKRNPMPEPKSIDKHY